MFYRRASFAALLLSLILLKINFYTSLLDASSSKFRLPAMPGVTITITQGNNQGDHIPQYDSEYAFDFIVGQSHFVETAAQGGTVIGFNSSSSFQCSGMNMESIPASKMLMHCWAYANFVLIADDDGTTASLYVHLLPYSDGTNMPKVTCGEHVNQGDPIGLAGTTGYSSGIHLHFQAESLPSSISISHCQQSDPTTGWWWTQSVPVSFSNPEVLKIDANGVPKTDQSFPVSILLTSTPISIPSPTPPTPILVPTPTQPPTPTPQTVLTPSTWQGQETSGGGSPYPTQLVIDSVNGNTFTGVYGIAGPGNSAEPIQNGQINGNTITFTTPTQVANEVATYKGTISGNTITGTWSYPGGGGTFTVTKVA